MYDWPGCEVEIRGVRPTYCRAYRSTPDMDDFRKAVTSSLQKLTFQEADVAGRWLQWWWWCL